MTRQRKSARILALTGSYKKDPQRKNHQEPELKVLSVSDVPEKLGDYERDCFVELMGTMPAGVFTIGEIPMLELTSRLLAQSRTDWDNFPPAKIGHLTSCLSKLGLTPGDRTKLVQPTKKRPNKFDEFD